MGLGFVFFKDRGRWFFKGSGLGFSGSWSLVFFRFGFRGFSGFGLFGFFRIRILVSLDLDIGFFRIGSFSFADTKMIKSGGDQKLIRQRCGLTRRKSGMPDEWKKGWKRGVFGVAGR